MPSASCAPRWAPKAAARLVTVPRVGYRLDGPVQRLAAAAPHLVLQAGQAVPGRPAYLLQRALGSGSSADVWLARHAKLGHARVFKFAADGARLGALRREFTLNRLLAQSLGPRDDFATVLDAHFHSEPFFLECAYGGQNLLDWAEESEAPLAIGAVAMPTSLALDQRIALFITLVRAVSDAHGVGVLHKDLKPGNVLVMRRAAGAQPASASTWPDAVPGGADANSTSADASSTSTAAASRAAHWQLRITDFGSARLLDRSLLQGLNITALGLSQTLDAGDHRISGTLMYLAPEVLAHQAASVRSDVYALGVMLYQWLVGDLRRPMATGWERDITDPLLRADIAAATDGDPSARLATAAELAQRLATLDSRRSAAAAAAQAESQRAQQVEQLARARARRPWLAAASAALLLGTGVSLWQAHEADSARRRSDDALKTSQATLDFLTEDVLTTPDLGRSGGDQPKPLLELARQGARQAGHRFAGLPMQEAAARLHLARTFQKLSATPDAVAQYEQADALLARLVPADDERLLSLRLAHALLEFDMGWAGHPQAQRRVAAALKAAGAQRLAQPTPLAVLAAQAQVASLISQGLDTAAVAAGRWLVVLADALPGQPALDRIDARRSLAKALVMRGDTADAEQVLADLDRPPLNAQRESALAMARIAMLQADLLTDAGQPHQARQRLQAALQRLNAMPSPSLWHLGRVNLLLAQLQANRGDNAAAADHLQQALQQFRRLFGDGHPFVLHTASSLGKVWLAMGRPLDALAVCLDSAPGAQAQRPDGRIATRELQCGLAKLAAGQPAEALAHLQTWQPPGPDDLPQGLGQAAWLVQAYKGLALEQLGRADEGQRLLAEAKAMLGRFDLLPTQEPVLDARFARLD